MRATNCTKDPVRPAAATNPSMSGCQRRRAVLAAEGGFQHNLLSEQVRGLLYDSMSAHGTTSRSAPMSSARDDSISRRQFLSTAAAGAAVIAGAPAVITASKTDSKVIVGEGDYKYEIVHEWPQRPDKFTWQTTNNVAVDKAGNDYAIHDGRADQKEQASIHVFVEDATELS